MDLRLVQICFELRREFPNLIGFKEFGGAADMRYAAEFITSQDDSVTLMAGVDTQVFHGFVNCNATVQLRALVMLCLKKFYSWLTLVRKLQQGCESSSFGTRIIKRFRSFIVF